MDKFDNLKSLNDIEKVFLAARAVGMEASKEIEEIVTESLGKQHKTIRRFCDLMWSRVNEHAKDMPWFNKSLPVIEIESCKTCGKPKSWLDEDGHCTECIKETVNN